MDKEKIMWCGVCQKDRTHRYVYENKAKILYACTVCRCENHEWKRVEQEPFRPGGRNVKELKNRDRVGRRG